MRLHKTRSIIIENGTDVPFATAMEGRAARPNQPAANDNQRPLRKILRQGARQIWRILPPVVGAGVVIYAMTQSI